MRLIPDKRDLRLENELRRHGLYAREIEHVASFVAVLRAAESPEVYFELHRTLLSLFVGGQSFLGRCKSERAHLRDEIKEARTRGASTDELRGLSRQLAAVEADARAVKAVLWIYKGLGDGLVWRILGYQRILITVLGDGEPVRRLARGVGLESELDEISYLWHEQNTFSVHADITNCVRYGDVLSVEAWDPLRVRLTEVKAGRAPDPGSKQMRRLDRVTELVNSGFHPEGADGKPLVMRRSTVRYRTHLDRLAELVTQAREKSYAGAPVEPGLLVEVFNWHNPRRLSRQDFDSLRATVEAEADLSSDSRDLLAYTTASRRWRDRRVAFSSLAPLCLFPLAVRDVADLIMGPLDVVVTLDARVVETRLRGRGIEARVARGDSAGDSFLRAERADRAVTVPATMREQVLVELMTLDTLFDGITWMLDDADRQSVARPAVAVAFSDESAVWQAYPAAGSAAA